jgi:hypothetical protein
MGTVGAGQRVEGGAGRQVAFHQPAHHYARQSDQAGESQHSSDSTGGAHSPPAPQVARGGRTRWHDAGKGRRSAAPPGRKERWHCRLEPLLVKRLKEGLAGSHLVLACEIKVDDLSEKTGRPAWLDADGDEGAALAGGVAGDGSSPLRLGIERGEVGGREHSDGSLRSPGRAVHLRDEVCARSKVPGLEPGGEASLLELPGDPLGPLAVSTGVADEEIGAAVLAHRLATADWWRRRGHWRSSRRSCPSSSGVLPCNVRGANEPTRKAGSGARVSRRGTHEALVRHEQRGWWCMCAIPVDANHVIVRLSSELQKSLVQQGFLRWCRRR